MQNLNSIMKVYILILAMLAISGLALAKPSSSMKQKEKLLDALLSLQAVEQDDDSEGGIQDSDDDDGLVFKQEEEEGDKKGFEAAMQNVLNLTKKDKSFLEKLKELEKKAKSKAEAQWYHVIHHIIHHYHYHHCHY